MICVITFFSFFLSGTNTNRSSIRASRRRAPLFVHAARVNVCPISKKLVQNGPTQPAETLSASFLSAFVSMAFMFLLRLFVFKTRSLSSDSDWKQSEYGTDSEVIKVHEWIKQCADALSPLRLYVM